MSHERISKRARDKLPLTFETQKEVLRRRGYSFKVLPWSYIIKYKDRLVTADFRETRWNLDEGLAWAWERAIREARAHMMGRVSSV